MADKGDCLSGVDGVIVINLDRRPDRWTAFQDIWRDHLPWERVVRLSASDGTQLTGYGQSPWFRGRKRDRTWAGRGGCALSHVRALREAAARGWDRVLILEDDAVPTEGMTSGAMTAVLARSDWSLLYLGCHEPMGPFRPAGDGLMGIHGALDAHAYVVTATLRDWLIERMPDEANLWPWIARERAVDRWYRREIGRRFTVMMCAPPLALQIEGASDITQIWRAADHARPTPMDGAPSSRMAFELKRLGEIGGDRLRAAVKRRVGF
ncbi:MAG: glycosyltransferase family 25 protein [Brevundimonas sp.]|uniref:glycosyltransferase family 25 protein n=1 Tax=Brevundimonas sp. TaxID=1871086 RepID=UPI00121BA873|nr:glycosyltransferase family 25 protein [Brevundimonas sp.]RZJ19286.1 MAG: glycosyltransferase family 25 protein [Brevundimonas sp.]